RAQRLLDEGSGILATGPVSPALEKQFRAQIRGVDNEIEHLLRDQTLMARLAEIRVQKDDDFDPVDTLKAYQEAFRNYGLDFDAPEVPVAASQLRTRPAEVVREVTVALDDWYLERLRRRLPDSDRFLQLAQAIDRDSWRGTLRERLLRRPIPL